MIARLIGNLAAEGKPQLVPRPHELVDALGGEREAIAWLEKEKKIDHHLPVREWKKERSLERLGVFGATAALFQMMGWDGAATRLERISHLGEARLLDGLVSVWQVAPVD